MYIKKYAFACPLCKGEVSGNTKEGYLCLTCFVKYSSNQLNLERELIEVKTDNKAIKKRLINLVKK